MSRQPATFKQADVVRAVRSAKAAGMKVEMIEVITKDGTTIRVIGKRATDGEDETPENLKDLM